MGANPYDFNRDGRWSTPERAFTHYGIGGELRRADSGRARSPGGCGSCLGGCGCAVVLLALLFLLFWMLASCAAS